MPEHSPERTTNRLLAVIVVLLCIAALKLAAPIFIVLLLTMLLTYLIDPLVVLLKKKIHLPLWIAVAVAAVLVATILGGIVFLFVLELPRFARSFPRFQEEMFAHAQVLLEGVERSLGFTLGADPLDELRSLPLRPALGNLARSSLRFLSEFVFVFFLAIILLVGKYSMIRKIITAFPRRHSLVPIMLRHIDRHMRAYLGIKALASLVIGIGTALILLAFKVEFAVTWGFLTILLNFVPTIGPLTAIALPTAVSLIQLPGWMPLAVLACLGVLHVGISNFIEPRYLGEHLDLNFFVIFISLFFWGWMWGAVGVFLAVPVTASMKIVLERIPATTNLARLLGRTARWLPRRRGGSTAPPSH